jgi:hypothetical protein
MLGHMHASLREVCCTCLELLLVPLLYRDRLEELVVLLQSRELSLDVCTLLLLCSELLQQLQELCLQDADVVTLLSGVIVAA